EQQRARLGLLGQAAKVSERDQAGRTVFRVRIGPFDARGDADALQARLQAEGVDARIVRVARP
ncbi:MAG: SPOR domain-containing protein, partial [Burkholderiales bacterium]|nr:SPOR domain-containing protein [Burkholderiales bacterium]